MGPLPWALDGANVEIHRLVGDENCVIFGLRAEEVQKYYREGGYSSWDLYRQDEEIRRVLDVFQKNPLFSQLYEDLLRRNDEYFVLKDFAAYREAHQEILRRYQDRPDWLRASAVNIAQSGHFSATGPCPSTPGISGRSSPYGCNLPRSPPGPESF